MTNLRKSKLVQLEIDFKNISLEAIHNTKLALEI